VTRVNLIPVEELEDLHLGAEYREIMRLPNYLRKSMSSKTGFKKSMIPSAFTLNTGHVKFFYDKGLFLENRFNSLVAEMRRRGKDPKILSFDSQIFKDHNFYNDYLPSERDLFLSRERIKLRISEKPHLYKKKDK